MSADSLRDDLLAIPGIEAAELAGSEDAPAGVRVRLSAGADAYEIGLAVQRVLAVHGLSAQLSGLPADQPPPPPASEVVGTSPAPPPTPPSDRAAAAASPAPPPPPAPGPTAEPAEGAPTPTPPARPVEAAPPPAATVEPAKTGPAQVEPSQAGSAGGEVLQLPGTEPSPEPPPPDITINLPPVEIVAPAPSPAPEPPAPAATVASATPPQVAVGSPVAESMAVPRLRGVSLEEAADGVTVGVTLEDGRSIRRKVRPGRAAIDDAIVRNVAELLGVDAKLLGVVDHEAVGTPLVTVVVETPDGERLAGSAVATGGRAYATGRAAWAALIAPAS